MHSCGCSTGGQVKCLYQDTAAILLLSVLTSSVFVSHKTGSCWAATQGCIVVISTSFLFSPTLEWDSSCFSHLFFYEFGVFISVFLTLRIWWRNMEKTRICEIKVKEAVVTLTTDVSINCPEVKQVQTFGCSGTTWRHLLQSKEERCISDVRRYCNRRPQEHMWNYGTFQCP